MMEDLCYDLLEQGRQNGLIMGRRQGKVEGWEYGTIAGQELGTLLGDMLHTTLLIHDDRARRLANDILAFPLTNTEDVEKKALLSRLQGRFKELCAVHPNTKKCYKEQKTFTSLQF